MSYTLDKIEKCYRVKAFMSYTIHRVNEYFIISFVLSHLFILFILFPLSLTGPVSFSLLLLLLLLLRFLLLLLLLRLLLLLLLLLLLQIGDSDGDGATCDVALMC
jgi:hypothetical protein